MGNKRSVQIFITSGSTAMRAESPHPPWDIAEVLHSHPADYWPSETPRQPEWWPPDVTFPHVTSFTSAHACAPHRVDEFRTGMWDHWETLLTNPQATMTYGPGLYISDYPKTWAEDYRSEDVLLTATGRLWVGDLPASMQTVAVQWGMHQGYIIPVDHPDGHDPRTLIHQGHAYLWQTPIHANVNTEDVLWQRYLEAQGIDGRVLLPEHEALPTFMRESPLFALLSHQSHRTRPGHIGVIWQAKAVSWIARKTPSPDRWTLTEQTYLTDLGLVNEDKG